MNLKKKRFLISALVLVTILVCFSCNKKEVAPTVKNINPIIDIVQAKKFLEDGTVFIDNRPERK